MTHSLTVRLIYSQLKLQLNYTKEKKMTQKSNDT